MMQDMVNKLVVAVSGGVDSVVLLDVLAKTNKYQLVVAHVNHGIRDDSKEDERLVHGLAGKYELPFELTRLNLPKNASEELARKKRYRWLEEVRVSHGAASIVTAHHQDDVLETMMINILRGTGWRGLVSLRSVSSRVRPLLDMSKAEIVAYALQSRLQWYEDSTNETLDYLRNRVRHMVVPRLTSEQRQRFIGLYKDQLKLRDDIEIETSDILANNVKDGRLKRHVIIMSDDSVSLELLRAWLGEPLERLRLYSLLRFAKTARPGDKWSLDTHRFVQANRDSLIVLDTRG